MGLATCGLNDEPQCIQNAAPGFTSPLQRGQTLAAAGATYCPDDVLVAEAGVAAACTGVPHCWQNFFPVTSAPQDAQVAIDGPPPVTEQCVYFALALLQAV